MSTPEVLSALVIDTHLRGPVTTVEGRTQVVDAGGDPDLGT